MDSRGDERIPKVMRRGNIEGACGAERGDLLFLGSTDPAVRSCPCINTSVYACPTVRYDVITVADDASNPFVCESFVSRLDLR